MMDDAREPASIALTDLPVPPERLLEEAPNGWVLTDHRGVICYVNQRVVEMFGFGREELLGSSVELLVPDQLKQLHEAHRGRYMHHPVARPMGLGLELTGMRKGGEEFPVEISLSPIQSPTGTYIIAVVQDIADRVALQEERNELQLELEMERERDRIGMDLHDGIMQEIYAAGLSLELALADLRERPESAEAEIERGIEQLHRVIRDIRSYIFDLRPRQFSGTLAGALSELAREFRQNTQIEVEEQVPESLPEVDMDRATAVYHIVHEALSNVRKHSAATRVSLDASVADGTIEIEVRDNGRGFDPGADVPQAHRGLRNMAARARDAGCDLDITSAPGAGTSVKVTSPLEA